MDNNPNGLKFGSFVEWIKKDDKLKADKIIKDVPALKKQDTKKEKLHQKYRVGENSIDSVELGYKKTRSYSTFLIQILTEKNIFRPFSRTKEHTMILLEKS
jgi:hypothetical protein